MAICLHHKGSTSEVRETAVALTTYSVQPGLISAWYGGAKETRSGFARNALQHLTLSEKENILECR